MRRAGAFAAILAAGAGTLILMAAQQPPALAGANGGIWEISGLPGAKSPFRECVANAAALAVIEHRGQNCSRSILSSGPGQALIHYTCGQAGFGDSKLTVITPRSLRIETQGISDQLPFNYVLQARRVGDCATH